MVEPVTATAAWLWRISQPYPREPLWKGLGEGDVQGFYLIRLNRRDKNSLLNSTIYFMFLPLI